MRRAPPLEPQRSCVDRLFRVESIHVWQVNRSSGTEWPLVISEPVSGERAVLTTYHVASAVLLEEDGQLSRELSFDQVDTSWWNSIHMWRVNLSQTHRDAMRSVAHPTSQANELVEHVWMGERDSRRSSEIPVSSEIRSEI